MTVDLFIGILGGLMSSLILFTLGLLIRQHNKRRRLGHLERLIPSDRRVQIVLPSAEVTDFRIKDDGSTATFPENVLIMPMREGMAVGLLANALHSLNRAVAITLTTDDRVSTDFKLTLSVGGPSVNSESRRILRTHTNFQLKYPDHIAEYNSSSYEPRRDANGRLLEDWGFVLSTKTRESVNVALCGVWGTGTEAAVRGLLSLSENRHRKKLARIGHTIFCFHISIDGLRSEDPKLISYTSNGETVSWN